MSKFLSMSPSPTPISIVLVKPLYSRNIGSVARVIANMGGHRLILVEPQCEIDLAARQGAAGAQTHLLEATHYSSWTDFFNTEPEGVRLAFCARTKTDTDPVSVKDRITWLKAENHLAAGRPLYLIFGPEDHGLTNEDLEYANFICTLPIYGNFKSLNLSHAVLLALYIIQSHLTESVAGDAEALLPATNSRFQFPQHIIQDWLQTLGFEIGERRTDVYKVLKRILLKNIATDKELRVLEAVLFQTVRKLRGDQSKNLSATKKS